MSRKKLSTKEKVLREAFLEFQRQGYKLASIDTIVKKAGVTKGALYYYFKSKKVLANAVLDNIITKRLKNTFLDFIAVDNEVTIQTSLSNFASSLNIEEIEHGTTFMKFAHEFCDNQDGVQSRVRHIVDQMNNSIIKKLEYDQTENRLNSKLNIEQLAQLISSVLMGALTLSKVYKDREVFKNNVRQLNDILDIVYQS